MGFALCQRPCKTLEAQKAVGEFPMLIDSLQENWMNAKKKQISQVEIKPRREVP